METLIVSLICIALIVFGGMTMSQGFMTSVDASTAGLEEIGNRDESIIRTALTPISTSQPSANTVEIVIENPRCNMMVCNNEPYKSMICRRRA